MTADAVTPLAYDPDTFGGWILSPQFDELAPAFVAALGELKDVTRSRTADATTYQYRYADLGDVLAEARPVLAAHGLAVFQTPTTTGDRVTIQTTVMHTSGQWLAFAPLRLPAGGTAQTIGSAITYARRYSVMASLGLATDDDDGAAASRGAPTLPVLMSASSLDRFRDAAFALSDDEVRAVVLTATGGRTDDVEAVWGSEVAALRAALNEFLGVAPGATGEGSGEVSARDADPSPNPAADDADDR